MINLNLDRHDFVAAVEGFAHGSHLRQHVWSEIVFLSIPKMTDDEMDFFWFTFRRNLWDCYFYKDNNGSIVKRCGHEDYLHALAALHRENRYQVTFCRDRLEQLRAIDCYRFGGCYRPFPEHWKKDTCWVSFNSFIPAEWIVDARQEQMPVNIYVEIGKEKWWTDLSVYDDERLL